jgi:hypothetical protein
MFRLCAADAAEAKYLSDEHDKSEAARREMFLPGNRSKTVQPGTPVDSAMVLLFCSPNFASWVASSSPANLSQCQHLGHVESAGNGV